MKLLKMRDLERATGVGRETIRFYIREGLLPEPERPGRNVALYDESFVDRIALIKELKQKRFLPLHVIRAVIGADHGPSRDEVQTLLELDGKLFPAVEGAPSRGPERLGVAARRSGLPAREIRRFAEVGVLEVVTRDGDQWLDDTGVRIVEVLARIRAVGFTDARGFPPQAFRKYVDFVAWLARAELRDFTRGVTGKVDTAQVIAMAEEGITHVNQLIGLMRRATLLRYVAEASQAQRASHPVARSVRGRRGRFPRREPALSGEVGIA